MSPYPMEQATMRPALLHSVSLRPARLLKLHNSVDSAFVGVDDESSFPLLEDAGGAAS